MDPEMQELMALLSTAIVPRHRRKAVVKVNAHAQYYSRSRYKSI
jgi:hypothetical protein